jgi:hypothetical protein
MVFGIIDTIIATMLCFVCLFLLLFTHMPVDVFKEWNEK